MLVKAKGFLNLLSSHDHEAHRVRIAEILIAVFPQDPYGFFLDVIVRIGFPDSWAGLQSFEKTQGCWVPQFIQEDDVGFGNNEIACHESAAALKQGGENGDGIFMMCIILVGQGDPSACVNEDVFRKHQPLLERPCLTRYRSWCSERSPFPDLPSPIRPIAGSSSTGRSLRSRTMPSDRKS